MKVCIYRLRCRVTDKFYIGSTTHSLTYRLKKHRAASREPHRMNSPLYTHFREVGWDNAEMSTLFELEVETRNEMLASEKAEILKHIGSELCLNHNKPMITRDEKKASDVEYGRQRRKLNPEGERTRVSEWRLKNPDKYKEQTKRYRQKRLESSKVV